MPVTMPNVVTSPRFFKNKALLAKAESTYGTDSSPTGAEWIEARNLSITPLDAETVDRNLAQPWMGSSGKIVAASWAKVSFEVLAAGSGTAGTAPKFDALLAACGFAKTVSPGVSVTYNLVSAAFASVSIYVNIDGVNHKLVGARGTVGLSLSQKQIPVLRFEFDAAFVDPAAVTMPSVTRTGWPVEEPVNDINTTALSISAVPLGFSTLELTLNTQRARLALPGPQSGVEITDRAPSGTATVIAPALATFNPFTLAWAATNVALSVTHGSAAGKKIKADAKLILSSVGYSDIEGMAAYDLSFDLVPSAGNDELAFTFL